MTFNDLKTSLEEVSLEISEVSTNAVTLELEALSERKDIHTEDSYDNATEEELIQLEETLDTLKEKRVSLLEQLCEDIKEYTGISDVVLVNVDNKTRDFRNITFEGELHGEKILRTLNIVQASL